MKRARETRLTLRPQMGTFKKKIHLCEMLAVFLYEHRYYIGGYQKLYSEKSKYSFL